MEWKRDQNILFCLDGGWSGDEWGNEWDTGWSIFPDVEHPGMFLLVYGDPIGGNGEPLPMVFTDEENAKFAVDHKMVNPPGDFLYWQREMMKITGRHD